MCIRDRIDIVPLYFAKVRPVVERDGNIIMVDDDRMKLRPGEKIENKSVRFRTLGCYPLTGGVESTADTLDEIIEETLSSVESERTSRVIDHDGGAASMEKRKSCLLYTSHPLIDRVVVEWCVRRQTRTPRRN